MPLTSIRVGEGEVARLTFQLLTSWFCTADHVSINVPLQTRVALAHLLGATVCARTRCSKTNLTSILIFFDSIAPRVRRFPQLKLSASSDHVTLRALVASNSKELEVRAINCCVIDRVTVARVVSPLFSVTRTPSLFTSRTHRVPVN